MSNDETHIPVMRNELIKYLNLEKGKTVLDCTIGLGGHAERILEWISPQGRLIGIDRDGDALVIAEKKLRNYKNYVLMQANFKDLDEALARLKVDKVDAMVFDLGVSSFQLDSAPRGFSIRLDAPLDMRMDKDLRLSAFDLVNFLPQEGLADILRKYGQERWHKRIARAIIREREKSLILTTAQLANLIRRIRPRAKSRIHPATRTFQALRIAVNNELDSLHEGLVKSVNYIRPGGRICVISFHSLEDKIVKNEFRQFAKEGKLKIITKKPLRASEEEVAVNPRSRSARLRAAERTEK